MPAIAVPAANLPDWSARLRLPLIAAPMFRVSGPDLVIAACQAGVIGTFPTVNARTIDGLDAWLTQIKAALKDTGGPQRRAAPEQGQPPRGTPGSGAADQAKPGSVGAPFGVNLIMRRDDLAAEIECLVKHRVEFVITSVGAPDAALGPLHAIGCTVFADVASVRHAQKAVAAGVDGLILLSAGAGGQTGWANGMAFARAVRQFYSGPLVMAGGVADGEALFAAQALGCDYGYMGTKFIATRESLAVDGYKQMLVASELDDVLLSRAFTGLETNTLIPSIQAAGLDPKALPTDMSAERAKALYGSGAEIQRWKDIWSAGHSTSGVTAVHSVADLVAETEAEYRAAAKRSLTLAQRALKQV